MQNSPSIFQEIIGSWMSMKTWVKTWLFFLNGIFIAAAAFPADPAST
jgi:hypothetical protein